MADGNTPAPDEAEGTGDTAILAEARDYLRLCIAADDQNRNAALDDLIFISGEQWDPRDRQQRAVSGRPCLTINKLPTFLHQVTNDQRQNKMGAKIHPVGDDDEEKAETVQGIVRHIEYASNANVATGTAVNSAATIGFGFYRLITRYCDEETFDQEIAFKRIRNAFTVYFDPGVQELDGSDQMRCMISEKMPRKEFRRKYPKANASGAQGVPAGTGDQTLADWLGTDFVRVSEFYKVELSPAWLVMTDQGPMWEDEMAKVIPPPLVQLKGGNPMRRKSDKRKVMWRLLTAVDVLETVEIPCKWIPVFPVFGDEIDLDGKVIRSGLVRHAKDPARMYNYWMTAATEEVALRAKTPYIGAEGQFEGYEDTWAAANTTSFPYLEYKPVTLDGTLSPPPSRQPMADVPLGTITMARTASDDIKATTGLFDSSIGARGTATSGIQERAQQLQGDTANFHYQDNSQITYRHAIKCLIDMVPHIYDGARIVKIMGEDEKIESKAINGAAEDAVDITDTKYDYTIEVGPAYSTARQEATDALIELGKNWPKLMDVAGDKVVGSMDFHGSEDVAERIKRTIPPNILGEQEKEGQDGQPQVMTPNGPVTLEQAGQMIAQLSQDAEMLTGEVEKASKGIPKAQIDAQNAIEVETLRAESQARAAEAALTLQRERIAAEAQARADEAAKALQLEAMKSDAKARSDDTAYLKAMDVAELTNAVKLMLQQMPVPQQLADDAELGATVSAEEQESAYQEYKRKRGGRA